MMIRKKLIEVSIPLEAINAGAVRRRVISSALAARLERS
jgi:hypothetical protein